VSANRPVKDYGMMSRYTAEKIITRALSESKRITFGFQGGEPTLWGLDHFRFFVETADRINAHRADIRYSLQTNGMHLNEEWITFLAQQNFLTGLSLDGYKELHDSNRVDSAGQSSYVRVLKAASLLRKAGAEFNVLSVVTSKTALHTEKAYRFYQSQNLRYLQFIPCIDDFGSNGTRLTEEHYGRFLKALFDLWYRSFMEGRGISVRYFDNLLGAFMGRPAEQCSMNGVCPVQFTVESDGGVYPCDFYVMDAWRLGNVHTESFESMLVSDVAKRFIAESSTIRKECTRCRWFTLCRGGCRRDREPIVNGVLSPNRFCGAYKDFFSYSYERFIKLRKHLTH